MRWSEIRKNKRDRKFNSKRVRLEETETGEPCISLEEVLYALCYWVFVVIEMLVMIIVQLVLTMYNMYGHLYVLWIVMEI